MDKEIVSAIFLTKPILFDMDVMQETTVALEKYFDEIGRTEIVYLIQEQDKIKNNQLWK